MNNYSILHRKPIENKMSDGNCLNIKSLRLRASLDPNFGLLQAFGYWPPEEGSETSKFIYKIFAILIMGFIYVLFLVTEICNMYVSRSDLEKLTSASFLFLTHFAQICKVYYFNKNREDIKGLLNALSSDIFKPRNSRQRKILSDMILETKVIYFVFISMCVATCMLWAVFPLIETASLTRTLPISAYYPFETTETPVYELIYTYQIVAATINAVTNASLDTVTSGFMRQVGAQLDLLNDTLVNLKEYSTENLENKGMIRPNNRHENELVDGDLQQEMHGMLVRCVNHHWAILRYSKKIGQLFSESVLSQFAASAIIICVTMFQLTLISKILSIQFISLVLYQGCMIVEIVVYCWFGNEIILKSSKISFSIYSSDWTHCSIPYKKSILIIMIRGVEPMKLYAGNFFTLSVETFSAIMRSAWSYFAVLNRVHE